MKINTIYCGMHCGYQHMPCEHKAQKCSEAQEGRVAIHVWFKSDGVTHVQKGET